MTFVVQYYAISLKFNHLYGMIVKNRDFVKLQTLIAYKSSSVL